MPFAVLLHFFGARYDLRGLPEQLVTRIEAASKHAYPSHGSHKWQTMAHVPIYEMLNWIEASGWTLHSASAGSKHTQLYVFHA